MSENNDHLYDRGLVGQEKKKRKEYSRRPPVAYLESEKFRDSDSYSSCLLVGIWSDFYKQKNCLNKLLWFPKSFFLSHFFFSQLQVFFFKTFFHPGVKK